MENKQWLLVRRGKELGQDTAGSKRVQTAIYKINQLQGYIAQHWEYSQYFIITGSGVYKNIKSLCCTPETNIVNQL